ncbi:MAG: hypothetical protein UY05_C0003G0011 [Candidatus Peregrinibacteria bacterium GW2011_GWA2_47_7]|nr:MAG: hypothetical protein UY05_C0003G0011 [Candidatus Peregrinibacteria bacterium GW2011_GWA2_47_7]
MSVFIEEHRKVFILALVIVLITFSFVMLLFEAKDSRAETLITPIDSVSVESNQ